MAGGKSNYSLERQILEKYKGDIDALLSVLHTLEAKKRTSKKTKQKYGDVVVELKSVSKHYKVGKQQVEALRNINIQVKQGEFVALTGPSGSGKSTLLQTIGALDKPNSGQVIVGGKDISTLSDRKLAQFRNKTVGFVFQFFYLQPFLNLQRNLEVPSIFAHTKRQVRHEKAVTLAGQIALSDRLQHLPNELSGGQMQRAAIARALMNNPKIILADEPTGNLDRQNAYAIIDLLESVRSEFGTTIVMVTHDRELAARADREIRMIDGVVDA